jgi:two-component system OmpR family sensor kinase
LNTRTSRGITNRHDEIGALGRDVDRMAGRIAVLLVGERQLLADVSHGLRSPLVRLSVATGLLRQRWGGQAPEEIDRIEREVQRLDALIGQSLILARIESGATDAASPIDVATIVQEVAADGDYEARAAGKRVCVIATAPGVIQGVGDLIRCAIENVVRNAIRFTAPGTVVEIDMERKLDADGSPVRIRIRDRGPGVPDRHLPEIFQPFRRVDASRPLGDGAGLGLAIADRVVRMHGGTITAANATDGGLLVEMTFAAI